MACTHTARSTESTYCFIYGDVSEHCSDLHNPDNNSHPGSLRIVMINSRGQNVLLVLKISNILNYSTI